MPLTQDWQAELRGLTLGAGTAYEFDASGVDGLGIPDVRSIDIELPRRHGSRGGYDVLQPRSLALPLVIDGTSVADAWGKLQALKTAWRPSSEDVPLDLRLPGMAATQLRFYGRPRGVDFDLERLKNFVPSALCAYEALDPLGYGAEVTDNVVGTEAVTNAGDADTDRVILTIHGNGGTPRVENTTGGGWIAFSAALAGGSTYQVDLRARTVLLGGSTSRYEDVAPGSTWFQLLAGANTIVVTGAASVDFTYRPAYL